MSDLDKQCEIIGPSDGFVNTSAFLVKQCENLVGRSNINDNPKHKMSNVRQIKLHVASKIES